MNNNEEVIVHPSQGQVVVNKSNGSQIALYGSDNFHSQTVILTFHESEARRDISHNFRYPCKDILEVEMSLSQWAMMVSSFGNGSGTPCTYRYRADFPGFKVPRYELPEQEEKILKTELDDNLKHGVELLQEARQELSKLISDKGSPSKKALEEINRKILSAYNELGPNISYINKCFSEEIEKKTSEVKIEIEAYIANRVRDAGLEALGVKVPPKSLA